MRNGINDLLIRRRTALRLAVATTVMSSSGCSGLLRTKDLHPVCPDGPSVSYAQGILTIDAHCHVFNGTDLQVKEFLSRVAIKQKGALGVGVRAIAEVLENLAWQSAPTGSEELEHLSELSSALQTCREAGLVQRVSRLKEDGYQRRKAQLQGAVQQSSEMRSLRSKRSLGPMSVTPDSNDAAKLEALTIIEQLPDSAKQYETQMD
jgi:hypothetical protein